MAPGHPRFEDVWSWDSKNLQKIEWVGNVKSFLSKKTHVSLEAVDMSDTSDPWMVLYQDDNGGVSACTFVMESMSEYDPNSLVAFYHNPLMPTQIDEDHFDFKEIWSNLSTEISPTYESMVDVLHKIGVTRFTPDQMHPNVFGKYPMYYLQAFRTVPQSINKYTIV